MAKVLSPTRRGTISIGHGRGIGHDQHDLKTKAADHLFFYLYVRLEAQVNLLPRPEQPVREQCP